MAKKKITGHSKLAVAASPSQTSVNDLNLVQKKSDIKPTSFRLTPEDKQRLKRITAAVNEYSPHKKISESVVIKALLFTGDKMNPERLLKAVREVIF